MATLNENQLGRVKSFNGNAKGYYETPAGVLGIKIGTDFIWLKEVPVFGLISDTISRGAPEGTTFTKFPNTK
jgi:hypothetical protein